MPQHPLCSQPYDHLVRRFMFLALSDQLQVCLKVLVVHPFQLGLKSCDLCFQVCVLIHNRPIRRSGHEAICSSNSTVGFASAHVLSESCGKHEGVWAVWWFESGQRLSARQLGEKVVQSEPSVDKAP